MKNIIKKISVLMLVIASVLIVPAKSAHAAGAFNPNPSPWGTGILSSAIYPANIVGLNDVTYAQPGNVVVLNIYYHNNGNQAINNARIHFLQNISPSSTNHIMSGSLVGDGVPTVMDTTTVQVSSSQTLTFIPGTARWFPNQSGATDPNGMPLTPAQESALVGGGGFNIGSLTPGWSSQGGIAVRYQVGNASSGGGVIIQPGPSVIVGVATEPPTVITNSAQTITDHSAVLYGAFNMNGTQGRTWFKWGTSSSNLSNQTPFLNWLPSSSETFSQGIPGLNPGTTYYYQACAEHTAGSDNGVDVCGVTGHFTTVGTQQTTAVSVTTNNPTNVDDNSATLNGYYDMNGTQGRTWFIWGTSSGNLSNQTSFVNRASNASGNFSETITGLSDNTNYYYKACAEHTAGTNNGVDVCGGIENFLTEDNYVPPVTTIDVITLSATNIDEDSAVLNGDLDDIGSGDVIRYFEWSTSSSTVSNGNGNYLGLSGTTNSAGQFSRTLSGLNDNDTYYFRACAEDDNGNIDCGSIRNFTTYDNTPPPPPPVTGNAPSVTTLNAVGIGQTYATCNGYYNSNGSYTDVWFEWGTSSYLGYSTSHQGKGNTAGGMNGILIDLAPNTTYYCQAVAQNNYGIVRGALVPFQTLAKTTIVTPPKPVVIFSNTNDAFLRLSIDDHDDRIVGGDIVDYDVTWENISGRTLRNVFLEIDLPKQLKILDTTDGKINKRENTIAVSLDDISRNEKGDMVVTVRVKNGIAGEPVVAQATAVFDHPVISKDTQVNVIAYDSDIYEKGTGFWNLFGGSPLGILIAILLIILLIMMIRKQYLENRRLSEKKEVVAQNANPYGGYAPYHPKPLE